MGPRANHCLARELLTHQTEQRCDRVLSFLNTTIVSERQARELQRCQGSCLTWTRVMYDRTDPPLKPGTWHTSHGPRDERGWVWYPEWMCITTTFAFIQLSSLLEWSQHRQWNLGDGTGIRP